MNTFAELFPSRKSIIGVVHLPPLPGFDGHPGMAAVVAHALADLHVLETQRVDGILLENEHDRPHQVYASAPVIAAMKEVTRSVVEAASDIVVGCEILLNDPRASLEVAAEAGARFIRTDYFVDRMSRPEYGEFAIDPETLIAYRDSFARGVLVFADIQVKYATMLERRSIAESAQLAASHKADAVVVTGDATGDAPRCAHLQEAAAGIAAGSRSIPVLIGSGLALANTADLLGNCEGAIVGTSLMENGRINKRLTARLMHEVRRVSSS